MGAREWWENKERRGGRVVDVAAALFCAILIQDVMREREKVSFPIWHWRCCSSYEVFSVASFLPVEAVAIRSDGDGGGERSCQLQRGGRGMGSAVRRGGGGGKREKGN